MLILLATWIAGCRGDDERLVRVTGSATRHGKPVPDLVITFVPDRGQRSFGLTGQDGKFTMRSASGQEGVPAGTHKVWVQLKFAGSRDDQEQQKRVAARQKDPEIVQILRKYGNAETTPITLEIKESREIALSLD